MKRGKRICNQLKAVRRQIADENGIPLQQPECTHQGECRGTCPRCEAEVRYLEQALTRRLAMGKVATVAGLTLSLAACGGGEEKSLRTDAPLDTLSDTSRTILPTAENDNPPDNDLVVTGFEEESSYTPSCDTPPKGDGLKEATDDSDSETEMLLGFIHEDMATFPGGEEAMYEFLSSNIRYPEAAQQENISGTVIVVFEIETDGSITDVKCLRDIGGGCGQEVIRVVKQMPRWEPGTMHGKPVRQQYSLPIQFGEK